MKNNDMIKVICQVAEELGYMHSEDITTSRKRIILKYGEQSFIVIPVSDLNTVTVACSIFNVGMDIDAYERAKMVNQMNLQLDCGCLVLLPDRAIEDQLEMILTKDIYAISKLHLRKALSTVLSRMSAIKARYINALTQAISASESNDKTLMTPSENPYPN